MAFRLICPAGDHAAALARHAVDMDLSRRGVHDPVLHDVAVVVTELVTNATQHGSPPVEVTVDPATDPHGASAILIEVWDSSPDTRPVLRDSDIHSARGRGMVLVDALSSSWGADGAENDRKRIWAYVTQAANDNNESPVVGHQNTAAPGPTNRTTPSSESLTTPQDNRRGSS